MGIPIQTPMGATGGAGIFTAIDNSAELGAISIELATVAAALTTMISTNQLQWVSEPYKYPLLLNSLVDKRPFLLMVDKSNLDNERGKPYAHLLKYASILHDEDRMALYLLPYNSFEKSVLDKVKEANNLMLSNLKANTTTYLSENDAEFLFEDWNKGNNVNTLKYAGKSGCKYLLNSGDVLFQGKIADSAKEGSWIFSIWMYIDEDKHTTSQFTITEVTKNKEKYEE